MVRSAEFKTTGSDNSQRPRGVVLIAHGLNLKPQRMDSLAQVLRDNGLDSFRMELSGHSGNIAPFKEVTREKWEDEFVQAFTQAESHARHLSCPLYFLGFSLGGALGLSLYGRPEAQVAFEKMVLLAPAVTIGPTRRLVRIFNLFGSRFCIPSANPADYRANRGTSMAAYNATLDIADRAAENHSAYADVSTLIFIDPKDELVSFKGLSRFLKQNSNLKIQLKILKKTGGGLARRIHHLIMDEQSLGPVLWNEMIAAVLAHFQSH